VKLNSEVQGTKLAFIVNVVGEVTSLSTSGPGDPCPKAGTRKFADDVPPKEATPGFKITICPTPLAVGLQKALDEWPSITANCRNKIALYADYRRSHYELLVKLGMYSITNNHANFRIRGGIRSYVD